MASSRPHHLYRRCDRERSLPRDSGGRLPMAARRGSVPPRGSGWRPTAAGRGPRPPAPTQADRVPHALMKLSSALFDTLDEGEILGLAMDT